MKQILYLFLSLQTSFFYAQDTDFTLGKVHSFSGKLVFEDVQPINKYDIVFSFENQIENYETNSFKENWNQSVKKAMMESGYQGGKPFDAIIISDKAERDIAIKFISDSPNNALASIGQRQDGIYIFSTGNPHNAYDDIATLKVDEERYDSEEAYDKIIKKAKKKYGNFNGIIFSTTDLSRADLIKFKDLAITGGGFVVGDLVMHKSGRRPSYGIIATLDNTSQKAGFVYLDQYGDEKITNIKYTDLTKIDEIKYQSSLAEQAVEVSAHTFLLDEKVTWNGGKSFGKVKELDNSKHNAKIEFIDEYGDTQFKTFDFLEIEKLNLNDYGSMLSMHQEEVSKFKFKVEEIVIFEKGGKTFQGKITELNDVNHKATISYTNEKSETQTISLNYLKIQKQK